MAAGMGRRRAWLRTVALGSLLVVLAATVPPRMSPLLILTATRPELPRMHTAMPRRERGVHQAGEPVARALVVADVGAGAQLTRLAAAADDLYIIDAAPGHVRRYMLHGLPYAELFTQVMRWKEGADKLIMGRPLDLVLSGERLLILDDLGSLWSYWGPTYSRLLVPLRLQSNQGAPVAAALHGGELLLLDRAKRNVWVYRPDAAGSYDTVPRALLPAPLPALALGTRLAVARAGLLILTADGGVLLIPWTRPTVATRLRLAPRATGVWADAARDRFLISTSRGVALVSPRGAVSWHAVVHTPDGEAIRDLALSPTGRLYVLTRTRILRVDAPVPVL